MQILLGFLAFDLCSNFGSFVKGFVCHASAFVKVGVNLGLILVEQRKDDSVVNYGRSIQRTHKPYQEHTLQNKIRLYSFVYYRFRVEF